MIRTVSCTFISWSASKHYLLPIIIAASGSGRHCTSGLRSRVTSSGTPVASGSSKGKAKEVIELGSSDHESGDVGDVNSPDIELLNGGTTLDNKVDLFRKEASQIWLSKKPQNYVVPNATKKFLQLRQDAYSCTEPSQASPILFRCELMLEREDGKKSGTRVPVQTHGFQLNEV